MPPEPEGAPDVTLTTALWLWRGTRADGTPTPAGWTFATIADDAANAVRHAAAMGYAGRAAFGSVKVRAQIGATVFSTSLFPHRDSGGYLLPVKAAVRRAEGVAAGDEVAIRLWLRARCRSIVIDEQRCPRSKIGSVRVDQAYVSRLYAPPPELRVSAHGGGWRCAAALP